MIAHGIDMPLSAKTVQDRTSKMALDITKQQIKVINSAVAYSIACDESKDKSVIEQITLSKNFFNHKRQLQSIKIYKKQQFSQVYAVTVITNSVYRQRQLRKTTSEFTEKKEKKEKKK